LSALPADLDALPRLDGFRLRGMQMTGLLPEFSQDVAVAGLLAAAAGRDRPVVRRSRRRLFAVWAFVQTVDRRQSPRHVEAVGVARFWF
jgi:hypothetical protein